MENLETTNVHDANGNEVNETAVAVDNTSENDAAQTRYKRVDIEKVEEKDFSDASVAELLTESSAYLEIADIRVVARMFRSIEMRAKQLLSEAREQAKAEFKAKNEDSEEGFTFVADSSIAQVFSNIKQFRGKKDEFNKNLEKDKAENYAKKLLVLERMKAFLDSTDEAAKKDIDFRKFQEEWKSIGPVPQKNADEIGQQFKSMVDKYYNERRMAFELRALDRKRNLETKLKACDKAEQLVGLENVNEAVAKLKGIIKEYRETGPVAKEEAEAINARFKAACDAIYEKRKSFSETFKESLKENQVKKQELIEKLAPYSTFVTETITVWNEKTKEILAIQQEWEKIGSTPKEVSKQINKQFWSYFKSFFANKNKFFDKLEDERKQNLKRKTELCEKAEALQDSSDWDKASDDLIKLQKEWKSVGPVVESQKEAIFARFKAACDKFFDRRRNRQSDEDKNQTVNLDAKLALCDELEKMAKDNAVDFARVDAVIQEFSKLGFVPKNKINSTNERFEKALAAVVEASSLSKAEKDQKKFDLQVNMMAAQGGLKGGRKDNVLSKRIEHLEKDVTVWKNNLEFFAKSKSADKLREEFSSKILNAQKEIGMLKAKLRALKEAEAGN